MSAKTAAVPRTLPYARTAPEGVRRLTWLGLLGTLWYPLALIVLLILATFVLGRWAYYMSTPFADTATYLDVGRNLLHGNGLVTRFNVVYGWSDKLTYPGLSYYNPLYGILLAIAWEVFHNPVTLSFISGVIPVLLNMVLIAALLRPEFGRTAALLGAATYAWLPSSRLNVMLIGIEHPLVTVCLVLLLIIHRLVPRNPRYWLLVGFLIGVGCLIKVNALAALPAILAGVFLSQSGTWVARARAALRPTLHTLAGFAALFVPFQTVCLIVDGKLYPTYPVIAKNWSMACTWGGEFVEGSPAIRPIPENLPSLNTRIATVLDNAAYMIEVVVGDLGGLALLIGAACVGVAFVRGRFPVYWFCLGAAFLLEYATAYYWIQLDREPSTAKRYALHVTAFWIPLAILGLQHVVAQAVQAGLRRSLSICGLWVALQLPLAYKSVLTQFRFSLLGEPRVVPIQRAMQACAALTEPSDVVALEGGSTIILGAMFLDRSIVPLPQGEMATMKNFMKFMEIYRPALVFPGNSRLANALLPDLHYTPHDIPSPYGDDEPERVWLRPAPEHR
jgi:hypothetical protein